MMAINFRISSSFIFLFYFFCICGTSYAKRNDDHTYFENNPSDLSMFDSANQKFTIYRNLAKQECYVESLRLAKSKTTPELPSRTLYVSKTIINPSHIMYKELGDDVIDFCKNLSILALEEESPLHKLPKKEQNIRKKRQASPRYKGQTQTQFISFGNDGKDDKKGLAEATAEHDKSRATVQGNIGMGQAQSQSSSGDCEECVSSNRQLFPTNQMNSNAFQNVNGGQPGFGQNVGQVPVSSDSSRPWGSTITAPNLSSIPSSSFPSPTSSAQGVLQGLPSNTQNGLRYFPTSQQPIGAQPSPGSSYPQQNIPSSPNLDNSQSTYSRPNENGVVPGSGFPNGNKYPALQTGNIGGNQYPSGITGIQPSIPSRGVQTPDSQYGTGYGVQQPPYTSQTSPQFTQTPTNAQNFGSQLPYNSQQGLPSAIPIDQNQGGQPIYNQNQGIGQFLPQVPISHQTGTQTAQIPTTPNQAGQTRYIPHQVEGQALPQTAQTQGGQMPYISPQIGQKSAFVPTFPNQGGQTQYSPNQVGGQLLPQTSFPQNQGGQIAYNSQQTGLQSQIPTAQTLNGQMPFLHQSGGQLSSQTPIPQNQDGQTQHRPLPSQTVGQVLSQIPTSQNQGRQTQQIPQITSLPSSQIPTAQSQGGQTPYISQQTGLQPTSTAQNQGVQTQYLPHQVGGQLVPQISFPQHQSNQIPYPSQQTGLQSQIPATQNLNGQTQFPQQFGGQLSPQIPQNQGGQAQYIPQQNLGQQSILPPITQNQGGQTPYISQQTSSQPILTPQNQGGQAQYIPLQTGSGNIPSSGVSPPFNNAYNPSYPLQNNYGTYPNAYTGSTPIRQSSETSTLTGGQTHPTVPSSGENVYNPSLSSGGTNTYRTPQTTGGTSGFPTSSGYGIPNNFLPNAGGYAPPLGSNAYPNGNDGSLKQGETLPYPQYNTGSGTYTGIGNANVAGQYPEQLPASGSNFPSSGSNSYVPQTVNQGTSLLPATNGNNAIRYPQQTGNSGPQAGTTPDQNALLQGSSGNIASRPTYTPPGDYANQYGLPQQPTSSINGGPTYGPQTNQQTPYYYSPTSVNSYTSPGQDRSLASNTVPQPNQPSIQGGGKGIDISQGSQITPIDTDSGETQSLTSIHLSGTNDTKAAASAQGKTRNGVAQAQVSGTYTGQFSAQAQTSDHEKSAQSEIFGNITGAISSSQGKAGKTQSQSQFRYQYDTGISMAEAQGQGTNYGTNSQIQAGNRGGLADAQSTGPGSTSSQAQIGFLPFNENRAEQKGIFQGGGLSSSQNSAFSGQSQSQLFGSFKNGPSVMGAAQSTAGKGQNVTKLSTFNSTSISSLADKSNFKVEIKSLDTNKKIPDKNNTVDKKENDVIKSTVPLPNLPQNDPVNDEEKSVDLPYSKQAHHPPSQTQDAYIKSEKFDAQIYRDTSESSSEDDLRLNGYNIPVGFRGKILSTAGDITQAKANSPGRAQSQTVFLKPGTGRVIVNQRDGHQPTNYIQGDSMVGRTSQENVDTTKNLYNQYVTVTKSETGELNNGHKKYAHTYYTKSSTCGYFTFTCNEIDGSNGRTKVCKPGPLTYADGTPC